MSLEPSFAALPSGKLLEDLNKFRTYATEGPKREDFLSGLDHLFIKADTNKNGLIDEEELESLVRLYMAHKGLQPTEEAFEHLFDKFKQHHRNNKEFDIEVFKLFIDHLNVKVLIPAAEAEAKKRGLSTL